MTTTRVKKKFVCADHDSLKTQLRLLEHESEDRELGLKTDSQNVILNLPRQIFSKKRTSYTDVKNPAGKLLAKVINQTVLKKENFIIKFVAGIFARQAGKKLAQKLLNTK